MYTDFDKITHTKYEGSKKHKSRNNSPAPAYLGLQVCLLIAEGKQIFTNLKRWAEMRDILHTQQAN